MKNEKILLLLPAHPSDGEVRLRKFCLRLEKKRLLVNYHGIEAEVRISGIDLARLLENEGSGMNLKDLMTWKSTLQFRHAELAVPLHGANTRHNIFAGPGALEWCEGVVYEVRVVEKKTKHHASSPVRVRDDEASIYLPVSMTGKPVIKDESEE